MKIKWLAALTCTLIYIPSFTWARGEVAEAECTDISDKSCLHQAQFIQFGTPNFSFGLNLGPPNRGPYPPPGSYYPPPQYEQPRDDWYRHEGPPEFEWRWSQHIQVGLWQCTAFAPSPYGRGAVPVHGIGRSPGEARGMALRNCHASMGHFGHYCRSPGIQAGHPGSFCRPYRQ